MTIENYSKFSVTHEILNVNFGNLSSFKRKIIFRINRSCIDIIIIVFIFIFIRLNFSCFSHSFVGCNFTVSTFSATQAAIFNITFLVLVIISKRSLSRVSCQPVSAHYQISDVDEER